MNLDKDNRVVCLLRPMHISDVSNVATCGYATTRVLNLLVYFAFKAQTEHLRV